VPQAFNFNFLVLTTVGRGQKNIFPATDLYWLACRSYAIALENHGSATPQATIRLLKIAIEVIQPIICFVSGLNHVVFHSLLRSWSAELTSRRSSITLTVTYIARTFYLQL
jgi:hypothetical protein